MSSRFDGSKMLENSVNSALTQHWLKSSEILKAAGVLESFRENLKIL